MNKTCTRCGIAKTADQFVQNKTKKDGLGHSCLECQRQYARNHYLHNKQVYKEKARKRLRETIEWLRSLKQRLACELCSDDHPGCLVFHHTDPKKKEITLALAARRGWSRERILKEIEKCNVLCASCHSKHHWEHGLVPVQPSNLDNRNGQMRVRVPPRLLQSSTPGRGTFLLSKSMEQLWHFNCGTCKKWWSIGDAPADKKEWWCPWCGQLNEEGDGAVIYPLLVKDAP